MQDHFLLTNQGRNRVVDACGLVCLTGYAALAWYSHGTVRAPELPGFFLLLGWVSVPLLVVFACFRQQPGTLPVGRLIFWALLFRCCGLFGIPLFEDDWFRYLWDGYRFAESGTPYGWAPADSFNDPGVPVQFQRILDQVNYPDLPTIYGPASQYAFLLSYYLKAGSLIPLQLLFICFDILLIRLLLCAAPAGYVLLYAWCPLVIKEIAFTAHPDGMGACLLLAAVLLRRREYICGAAACLALAVGNQDTGPATGAVCPGAYRPARLGLYSAPSSPCCTCRSCYRAALIQHPWPCSPAPGNSTRPCMAC